MEKKEIALQITLKALEMGYIEKRDRKTFDDEDPIKSATEHTANRISDFYLAVLSRLNET